MTRKLKKYCKLRGYMTEMNITQTDLFKYMKKSQTWLTNRFTGKDSFTIDEGYRILDWFGIPHTEFTEYFPPGGFFKGSV